MIKTALSAGANVEFVCFCLDERPDFLEDLSSLTANKVQMEQMSSLKNPSPFLAVLEENIYRETFPSILDGGHYFFLDQVRDPGNLGAILRIADWFGMNGVILNEGCADPSNPKVIQASMGSIFKGFLYKAELPFVKAMVGPPSQLIGLDTNGEDIRSLKMMVEETRIFVLGNEGRGIQKDNRALIDHYVRVPSVGQPVAESLNVAMTAAVVAQLVSKES